MDILYIRVTSACLWDLIFDLHRLRTVIDSCFWRGWQQCCYIREAVMSIEKWGVAYSTGHRAVVSLGVYRWQLRQVWRKLSEGKGIQEYTAAASLMGTGCLESGAAAYAWTPVCHREIDRVQLFLPGCQEFKPFHFLSFTWVSQYLASVQSTSVDDSK